MYQDIEEYSQCLVASCMGRYQNLFDSVESMLAMVPGYHALQALESHM